ncbi:MAG: hypothetical protein HN349_11390 [Gammaproteobacteria bacterium]|nr:hypothetical protein [Gammaproteobacteria bacterium]MBT4196082.1 hypothetical protein [Gammaproteobacteria bacterium]MBT7047834.1 hypothetical protein [Gammaproteobacteria bacterium]
MTNLTKSLYLQALESITNLLPTDLSTAFVDNSIKPKWNMNFSTLYKVLL